MALQDLANASNEKRIQNIMRLRQGFRKQEFYTIAAAAKSMGGYSYNTVLKWAKDGNIPLLGKDGQPVVKLTAENKPSWIDDL